MRNREGIRRIVEEIEYLLAKRKLRAMERPRFLVVHGHHQPETTCLHGETVEQVLLAFRARKIPLRLSPTGLLIADCLARYRHIPLSAAHMARIFSSDPFYVHLGANAVKGASAAIKPKRTSVKVYIQRLRTQLAKVLKEAGLNLLPEKVLVSETTDSNVVVYRLNAQVEIVHQAAPHGKGR